MNRPSSTTIPAGPISRVLESELRRVIQQREIVIWLDAKGTYTGFVDSLMTLQEAGELPYAVKAFRGSHLQLLFDLQTLNSGASRHPMVVHMPGFNRDSIKQTPMLELYLAGRGFEKRFSTLVTEAATGRVTPEQIKAFLGAGDPSLADADQWLTDMLHTGGSSIATHLQTTSPESLVDDLLTHQSAPDSIAARINEGTNPDAVWTRLGGMLGLPEIWRHDLLGESRGGGNTEILAEDIAFVMAGWAMAVEYVDDLQRDPVDPRLSVAARLAKPLKESCHSLAVHLRQEHAKFYGRTADEVEGFLDTERTAASAEDLGRIDTFRFEEERILEGTLEALRDQQWELAETWASRRTAGNSFWLRDQPERESVWRLLHAAAELGLSVASAGPRLANLHNHEEAIERYTSHGAAVDRAHRHLEQQRRSLLYPSLPLFDRLRERLDEMREVWRRWADAWAVDFGRLCKQHGFLPPPSYRQRNFFDDVVAPLCKDGECVAVFAVDAFRFEMAGELFDEFDSAKATTAHLNGRLAELPTVTSVGMNALAPVNHQGKMKPDLKNGTIRSFHSGQFQVKDPATRKRAMHEKVGGRTCPTLTLREVVQLESKQLRRKIAGAKLVYVHSQEIDDAGEKDLGPVVFDYAMQNIRAAWQLLREAGVKQFVITADHGFLLRDGLSEAQAHGRKVDPRRRHVIRPPSADHPGELRVPLSELGYEGCDEHLMFPETTAAFDIGNRSLNYLHGGNSLQERLIPVITISHRVAVGGQSQRYEFANIKVQEPVGGMHCITATLRLASEQSALGFEEGLGLTVALQPLDDNDVSLELCQVRGGGAQLKSGTIIAKVGSSFEVFFRLTGDTDARARVQIYHPAAEANVTPTIIPNRFTVTVVGGSKLPTDKEVPAVDADETSAIPADSWLNELSDNGVRQFFNHLEKHGTVTEEEAVNLLGGVRHARRFASKFEAYAARAPFEARIDVIGGVKRYVREHDAEFKIMKESD